MKPVYILSAIVAAVALVASAMFGFELIEKYEDSGNAAESGILHIDYIDVGQADATLIVCDGEAMLIDGGNVDDSDLIYTYLEKNGIEYLDYLVATHAHEDHMGGLSGALNYADVGKIYCPVTENDTKYFSDFKRLAKQKGLKIEVPFAGESFSLGSADVEVLACNTTDDENNSSIVLKLTHGENKFLFMADAEFEVEEYIIDKGFDIDADVLKAGHHGSSTSTSNHFLYLASPEYAVISCGKDNSYGHPHKEVTEKFAEMNLSVYRTDLLGDIYCTSDGKTISFKTEKKDKAMEYILNTNSKKFHTPDCENTENISAKNRKKYKGTLLELSSDGYSPCGLCG